VLWRNLLASLHWSWWFRVLQAQLRIVSEVWNVDPTFTPVKDMVAYWCSCRGQNPVLNMGVDVMNQVLILNLKRRVDYRTWVFSCIYRVCLVYRWIQDNGGARGGVYGQSLGRRLIISLRKCATIFQTEVYAILACVYEIQTNTRPEKYISIFSVSHVALKALQAAKTSLNWYNSTKRHGVMSLSST
jgi:hypothetical protein